MLVTDTLASDGAASREILSTVPPLPREPAEQPRGSLPSTDAATRTTHAQVQIPTAGPAFSLCSWPHQQPVSLRATSHERAPLSLVPCSGLCDMARGDVRSECSLTETSSDLGDFRERLYPTCYAPGALPNRPDWTDIGDLGFLSLGYSFQEIALSDVQSCFVRVSLFLTSSYRLSCFCAGTCAQPLGMEHVRSMSMIKYRDEQKKDSCC